MPQAAKYCRSNASRTVKTPRRHLRVPPCRSAANDVQHVDTALEALTASLNRYGRVDLPYMSRLSDIAPDELVVQLEGRIYHNPMAKTYEIADRFIAGNVIEKGRMDCELPDRAPRRRSVAPLA